MIQAVCKPYAVHIMLCHGKHINRAMQVEKRQFFWKQYVMTLHTPHRLGEIPSWDHVGVSDSCLAVLSPAGCWTAYRKMDDKVQVRHTV